MTCTCTVIVQQQSRGSLTETSQHMCWNGCDAHIALIDLRAEALQASTTVTTWLEAKSMRATGCVHQLRSAGCRQIRVLVHVEMLKVRLAMMLCACLCIQRLLDNTLLTTVSTDTQPTPVSVHMLQGTWKLLHFWKYRHQTMKNSTFACTQTWKYCGAELYGSCQC